MSCLPSPVRAVVRRLDGRTKLALGHNPYPSVPALLDDAVVAAIDVLVSRSGGVPWDEGTYRRVRDGVRSHLEEETLRVVQAAAAVLAVAHEVSLRTSALDPESLLREDFEVQMQGLDRELYEYCDQARSAGAVGRHLRRTFPDVHVGPPRIRRFLEALVANRLMVTDGEEYLSLALRAPDVR